MQQKLSSTTTRNQTASHPSIHQCCSAPTNPCLVNWKYSIIICRLAGRALYTSCTTTHRIHCSWVMYRILNDDDEVRGRTITLPRPPRTPEGIETVRSSTWLFTNPTKRFPLGYESNCITSSHVEQNRIPAQIPLRTHSRSLYVLNPATVAAAAAIHPAVLRRSRKLHLSHASGEARTLPPRAPLTSWPGIRRVVWFRMFINGVCR